MIFRLLFSLNVFLGSFLLFLIQPLIGKILTPLYGGVSQIWILCLFFFQLTLLGGYTFTYLISKLQKNYQAGIYIALIILSLFILEIPTGSNINVDYLNPVRSLLILLGKYLFIPLFFISSVSTLMQNWFGMTQKEDPYFLYSISNTGSVLALLVFPLILEPNFSIDISVALWKYEYWVLAITVIILSLLVIKKTPVNKEKVNINQDVKISIKSLLTWIFLSFMGTGLLLTYTAYLTQNIAPVPLLWIIPLGLYLYTFIVIFAKNSLYNRSFYTFMPFLLGLLLLWQNNQENIVVFKLLTALFLFYCLLMMCNGELYNLRPQYEKLPVFYLCIAFGGALGGFFVNLVAPFIFNSTIEFILINTLVFTLIFILIFKHNLRLFFSLKLEKIFRIYLAVALLYFLGVHIKEKVENLNNPDIIQKRNFYSAVSIKKSKEKIEIIHGMIKHGFQPIDETTGALIYEPTAYFSRLSPLGIVVKSYREKTENSPLKIGVIGLGAGIVSAYGREGDLIDFYEIDNKIIDIAQKDFSYIKDSKAKINIILGDGRLKLNNRNPQKYDILLIDAFNSDAIPLHLLTKEALNVYFSHLKKDGLILFHISNRYLNLNKVISNLAILSDYNSINLYSNYTNEDKYLIPSTYTIISKNDWFNNTITEDFLKKYPHIGVKHAKQHKNVGIWTDNYSNIISVFK